HVFGWLEFGKGSRCTDFGNGECVKNVEATDKASTEHDTMKIIGGRRFSRNKRQRPLLKRRQKRVVDAIKVDRKQATERWLFGTLGAASSVRKIDPATGKIIAIIPAHPENSTR